MVVGLACVTLSFSLRKGSYFGDIQWYIIRKAPTVWANLYGLLVLGMGNTIYARYVMKFTETRCLTNGLQFEIFTRVSKLVMGVIKKQDFTVTSKIFNYLLMGWDTKWRRKGMSRRIGTSCLVEAVVVGF